MKKTTADISGQAVNEVAFYNHNACEQCPHVTTSTVHLSRFQRGVMDALGDVHLTLMRDPEGLSMWDVGVQVYDVDAPPGTSWAVEHACTVGTPAYMPPGCPEWLWLLYLAVGDMCTHFMDQHGAPQDAPSGSRLLSNDV